jgi:hypothetical protein
VTFNSDWEGREEDRECDRRQALKYASSNREPERRPPGRIFWFTFGGTALIVGAGVGIGKAIHYGKQADHVWISLVVLAAIGILMMVPGFRHLCRRISRRIKHRRDAFLPIEYDEM